MMASIEHSINSNNIHYCLRRSNSITVASALADFFPVIFMLCCGGDDTEFIIVGCGENVHNRLSQEQLLIKCAYVHDYKSLFHMMMPTCTVAQT